MIKFINRLTNTLLVLTGIAAAIGLIYTLKPELFQYAFETLNLTETQVALASTILSGIAVFGSLSKYFKGIINTQQALNKSETNITLRRQEEKHTAELEQIKQSRIDELKLYTEVINELINSANETKETNKLILANLAITAQRNLNSNIVSPEDKNAYRAFLTAYRTNKPADKLKNLFTEVTIETITEETKPESIEPKEEDIENIFQNKLKGNK